MQPAKEKAASAAASAKAGLEKTQATLQEKAEKITTRDPLKKEMATEKKEERKEDAEFRKQAVHDQNAANRHGGGALGGGGYTT